MQSMQKNYGGGNSEFAGREKDEGMSSLWKEVWRAKANTLAFEEKVLAATEEN
jgi:hypothetical protein